MCRCAKFIIAIYSAGPSLAGKTPMSSTAWVGAVNTPRTVCEGSAAVWGPAPRDRNYLGSPVSAPSAQTGIAVLG